MPSEGEIQAAAEALARLLEQSPAALAERSPAGLREAARAALEAAERARDAERPTGDIVG